MSSLVQVAQTALLATVIGSAAVAVADVVVDSIVVERTREAEEEQMPPASQALSTAGDLQSLCWSSSAVGGIVSAFFAGSLLEVTSPQQVFAITALFPLIIAISAFGVQESRVLQGPSFGELSATFRSQFEQLRLTFSDPRIYIPGNPNVNPNLIQLNPEYISLVTQTSTQT